MDAKQVEPKFKMVVDRGDAPRDEVDAMLEATAAELGMSVSYEKISACETCQHFSCVCAVLRDHVEGCRYRLAVTCAIPIACELHGNDVCAACGDVCTCDEMRRKG